MSKILGLDVGTNSLGWSLIEENKKIIDLGVRIFPIGLNQEEYQKGKEVSKNATRRIARGIRRLNFRYKLRRQKLKAILRDLEMMPSEEMILKITSTQLYFLRKKALDEKITLKELGRILLLLNQRRGFKSSKKDVKTEEQRKEREGILKEMNELSQKVSQNGFRTLGEYFWDLYEKNKLDKKWHNPDEPIERIRSRFIYRALYEKEFDFIWEAQKKFYLEILTDENYQKIKNECIYYQRPLKSQKHLVGNCRFEPNKKVAPKSSFEFQEFRIWQTLNTIKLNSYNNNRFRDFLSQDEKNKIFAYLQNHDSINKVQIKKVLDLSSKTTFNDIADKIYGNTTNAKLRNALGTDYYDSLNDIEKYKLWHTLYFANDEEWLENYSKNTLRLNDEQVHKYINIYLEPDYCSISHKAICKILPFLKEGYVYSDACQCAGYHHSFDKEEDDKNRELKDKLEITKEDNLRNPLVQQSVNETIRVINEIIAEYGKPDIIRVELARELKKPKWKREKILKESRMKESLRESYVDFLKRKLNKNNVTKSDLLKFELWLEMEFSEKDLQKIDREVDVNEFRKFSKNVKQTDKEKYKLYLECGRISPYTGSVITLSKLFSPEIEIEHIIPYSKCMDNSFLNKTLSEREFNAKKNNLSPYLFFKDNPDEFKKFKERIKHLPEPKQEKFLLETMPDDFLNNQLSNNAYIAKQIRKKLKTICKNVYISNGQATSILRRFWGLNHILNPDGTNEKSRDDHRHHAIDALVIANTTTSFIQKLCTESKFDENGKIRIKDFPMPYDRFFVDAEDRIDSILISYRNKKRLISRKPNKYKIKNGEKIQKSTTIRGPLHEESLYGQIQNPHEDFKNTFVIRKPVNSLKDKKQIEKIVDPKIRQTIYEHIENNGGNIEKALKSNVFMTSKDGLKVIPIKKVRIKESAEELIQLRKSENENLFVASGNNYRIGIFINEKGKREYETISFYEAVNRRLNNKNLYHNSNELYLNITHNDLIVIYEKNPSEINWKKSDDIFNRLYRIVKFDSKGRIGLAKHIYSNINPDTPKKYPNGVAFVKSYSSLNAIKIHISILGKPIIKD